MALVISSHVIVRSLRMLSTIISRNFLSKYGLGRLEIKQNLLNVPDNSQLYQNPIVFEFLGCSKQSASR
jgi:hypothetical protein